MGDTNMYAAILGYGTIGAGVAALLEENAAIAAAKAGESIEVKYVLDIRDFPGDPVEKKLVRDIQVILEDPDVEVVVETMGGTEPAHTFVKGALEAVSIASKQAAMDQMYNQKAGEIYSP